MAEGESNRKKMKTVDEITIMVKTIDSSVHPFRVPSDMLVDDLRSLIADTVNIPARLQRCIYMGRILDPNSRLSSSMDCNVVHVVAGLSENHIAQPPPSVDPVPAMLLEIQAEAELHRNTVLRGNANRARIANPARARRIALLRRARGQQRMTRSNSRSSAGEANTSSSAGATLHVTESNAIETERQLSSRNGTQDSDALRRRSQRSSNFSNNNRIQASSEPEANVSTNAPVFTRNSGRNRRGVAVNSERAGIRRSRRSGRPRIIGLASLTAIDGQGEQTVVIRSAARRRGHRSAHGNEQRDGIPVVGNRAVNESVDIEGEDVALTTSENESSLSAHVLNEMANVSIPLSPFQSQADEEERSEILMEQDETRRSDRDSFDENDNDGQAESDELRNNSLTPSSTRAAHMTDFIRRIRASRDAAAVERDRVRFEQLNEHFQAAIRIINRLDVSYPHLVNTYQSFDRSAEDVDNEISQAIHHVMTIQARIRSYERIVYILTSGNYEGAMSSVGGQSHSTNEQFRYMLQQFDTIRDGYSEVFHHLSHLMHGISDAINVIPGFITPGRSSINSSILDMRCPRLSRSSVASIATNVSDSSRSNRPTWSRHLTLIEALMVLHADSLDGNNGLREETMAVGQLLRPPSPTAPAIHFVQDDESPSPAGFYRFASFSDDSAPVMDVNFESVDADSPESNDVVRFVIDDVGNGTRNTHFLDDFDDPNLRIPVWVSVMLNTNALAPSGRQMLMRLPRSLQQRTADRDQSVSTIQSEPADTRQTVLSQNSIIDPQLVLQQQQAVHETRREPLLSPLSPPLSERGLQSISALDETSQQSLLSPQRQSISGRVLRSTTLRQQSQAVATRERQPLTTSQSEQITTRRGQRSSPQRPSADEGHSATTASIQQPPSSLLSPPTSHRQRRSTLNEQRLRRMLNGLRHLHAVEREQLALEQRGEYVELLRRFTRLRYPSGRHTNLRSERRTQNRPHASGSRNFDPLWPCESAYVRNENERERSLVWMLTRNTVQPVAPRNLDSDFSMNFTERRSNEQQLVEIQATGRVRPSARREEEAESEQVARTETEYVLVPRTDGVPASVPEFRAVSAVSNQPLAEQRQTNQSHSQDRRSGQQLLNVMRQYILRLRNVDNTLSERDAILDFFLTLSHLYDQHRDSDQRGSLTLRLDDQLFEPNPDNPRTAGLIRAQQAERRLQVEAAHADGDNLPGNNIVNDGAHDQHEQQNPEIRQIDIPQNLREGENEHGVNPEAVDAELPEFVANNEDPPAQQFPPINGEIVDEAEMQEENENVQNEVENVEEEMEQQVQERGGCASKCIRQPVNPLDGKILKVLSTIMRDHHRFSARNCECNDIHEDMEVNDF